MIDDYKRPLLVRLTREGYSAFSKLRKGRMDTSRLVNRLLIDELARRLGNGTMQSITTLFEDSEDEK